MQKAGADQTYIDEYKRSELLRRSIIHVKQYAQSHYPRKYTHVKSKVRGNLKSRVKAHRSQLDLHRDVSISDFNTLRQAAPSLTAQRQSSTSFQRAHQSAIEDSLVYSSSVAQSVSPKRQSAEQSKLQSIIALREKEILAMQSEIVELQKRLDNKNTITVVSD